MGQNWATNALSNPNFESSESTACCVVDKYKSLNRNYNCLHGFIRPAHEWLAVILKAADGKAKNDYPMKNQAQARNSKQTSGVNDHGSQKPKYTDLRICLHYDHMRMYWSCCRHWRSFHWMSLGMWWAAMCWETICVKRPVHKWARDK